MDSAPRRRRWFRFRLRTLLLALTVLACWLGWLTSVVRQRLALIEEIRGKPGVQVVTAEQYAQRFPPGAPTATKSLKSVSKVRAWMGDRAIQEIWYPGWKPSLSEDDLRRIRRVLPEAALIEEQPEPCHPGCFPAGTLIDTPDGARRIESIRPGERVTTIDAEGRRGWTAVQSVFTTSNRLWQVETAEGALWTTATQPLRLADGQTCQAGKLRPGDLVVRHRDGSMRSVEVLAVSASERWEPVFNLILGESQVFVAGGFLARSKPPRSN